MSIELINVSKKYKDFSIKEVSFKVEKGGYHVLLGRSGAGKSLILEIIAGFKKADSGKILVNGIDITNKKIQKRNVSIVFQDLAIFPHKTVRENIAYSLKRRKTKSEIKIIVEQLAKEMNITRILDKKPNNLSGGEIQRTVIARTLASKPEVLLLDEPLSALDVQLKSEIRLLLKELNRKGYTIIHITHDFDEAVRMADRVSIINKGKVLQTGTVKEVFNRPKSKFAANIAGINNFYKGELFEITGSKTKKLVINDKVSFFVLTEEKSRFGFVIIRSEDVIISEKFHSSSARNNFKGIVTNICYTSLGIEVETDIGVKILAVITETSLKNLDIQENKEIWVSFKASGIKFIGS